MSNDSNNASNVTVPAPTALELAAQLNDALVAEAAAAQVQLDADLVELNSLLAEVAAQQLVNAAAAKVTKGLKTRAQELLVKLDKTSHTSPEGVTGTISVANRADLDKVKVQALLGDEYGKVLKHKTVKSFKIK